MPRFTLCDEGPVTVAYGHDHLTGYFITVTDRRLQNDGNHDGGDDFITVCENICKDGEGIYLDLHTGIEGWGPKVDRKAMAEVWRRYGVGSEHVERLLKGTVLDGEGVAYEMSREDLKKVMPWMGDDDEVDA